MTTGNASNGRLDWAASISAFHTTPIIRNALAE